MPSSTSSFEAETTLGRAPRLAWGRSWIAALLASAVLASLIESGWRSSGRKATVVDTPLLWAFHRAQAYAPGGRVLVLAGTSRTQVGIDPEALARRLPGWKVLQLAVDGTYGAATVEDLAGDPGFRGVILCDTLGPAEMTPKRIRNQQPFVDTFRTKRWTLEPWGYSVSAEVQERLVLLNPDLSLRSSLSSLLSSRRLPPVSPLITRPDRLRMADYQGQDLEPIRQRWRQMTGEHASRDDAFRASLAAEHARFFDDLARRLEARGSRLVLLRMPRSKALQAVEQSLFPDDGWWTAHTANPHLVAVDAVSEPRLSGYQCPDDSHLDRRDLEGFANDLHQVLAGRGVFDAVTPPGAAR